MEAGILVGSRSLRPVMDGAALHGQKCSLAGGFKLKSENRGSCRTAEKPYIGTVEFWLFNREFIQALYVPIAVHFGVDNLPLVGCCLI